MKPVPGIAETMRKSRGNESRRIRAQKLGISTSLLEKIEYGLRQPSAEVLMKQASLDGKPLDFYFTLNDHVS